MISPLFPLIPSFLAELLRVAENAVRWLSMK